MTTIRGVILDYGEVLCKAPDSEQIDRMAQVLGLPRDAFETRYFAARGPYDRGDVTPEKYWAAVAPEGSRISPEALQQLRRWDVEMWSSIDRDMTDWIAGLRSSGMKTGLLSNMHVDMARHARSSFDWLAQFDCVVLSCEVRRIKPEPEIYRHCVECLDVRPEESCFIDDRRANVLGAREAGLHALEFRSVSSLREQLTELGVTPLPVLRS